MRWSKRLISSLVLSVLAAALADSQSLTLVHKKKYVMGTVFEVVAYHDSPTHASNAIDEAFQEVALLDSIMSNYKSDSDLSRLNRTAHFHAESVSPDLYRVIETSLRYSKLSDGEFDITVGPLVNFWKSVIRESAPGLLATKPTFENAWVTTKLCFSLLIASSFAVRHCKLIWGPSEKVMLSIAWWRSCARMAYQRLS